MIDFQGKVINMKKIISLGLVLVIVASISFVAFASNPNVGNGDGDDSISWDEIINGPIIKGDLNNDKIVTVIDARQALKKAVDSESVSSRDLKVADFNGDNKITVYDARQILKLAAD